MPELALDHKQRDPLAGQLDRMRVAQLMRREPPTDTRCNGGVVQPSANARRRAGPTARWSVNNAEQSPER